MGCGGLVVFSNTPPLSTKNTIMKKRKKESIVVFEDWFKYARCLNDKEFREMMNAILEYYKSQKLPEFSGMLQEVWDDIFEDLEINVSKRQAKRDTMLRNAKRNPKLNTTPNITPDIGPDTEPNIVPNTSGMVDGRLEMVDGRLKMDDGNDNKNEEVNGDGDDKGMEWFLKRLESGTTFKDLSLQYPNSSSLKEALNEWIK